MTKRSIVNKRKDQKSYGIKIETEKDTFVIPVIDVRDGDNARESAAKVLKNRNATVGSKYFNRSYSLIGHSYNLSMKNK